MKDLNLDAYYFGFEATGVSCIDKILYAVARAGKSFHHTGNWTDDTTNPDGLTGNNPVAWIQNAANAAAEVFHRDTPHHKKDVNA